MSKVAATLKRNNDASDAAQLDHYLKEIKRVMKEVEADRLKGPICVPRKISIVDEVKAILGKR